MKLRRQNEELSERISKLEEKLKQDQLRSISQFKNATVAKFEKELEVLNKKEQEIKDQLQKVMDDVNASQVKIELLEKARAKAEMESKAVEKLSASTIATIFGGGRNLENPKPALKKKGSRKDEN